MNTAEILSLASQQLVQLHGRVFDVLAISKPVSAAAAANLAKIVSKLSPIIGNLIEFNLVEFLNDIKEFAGHGKWRRQDPGFPDAVFEGEVSPMPGLEIKAWYPLATEITARFKDSQNHFQGDKTSVVLLAWVPSHLVFGKPYILDIVVVPGLSVAKARDDHYHNPPDYLVLEPEDTSSRTRNLQQTNTSGYKFQGTPDQRLEAEHIVEAWGAEGRFYKPTRDYQELLRELTSRFPYRLDTNFAKIDRIVHKEIELFKSRVLSKELHGKTIKQWSRFLSSANEVQLEEVLSRNLAVEEKPADDLLR